MTKIQFLAAPGEANPVITLSPWGSTSGTPTASYGTTEVSDGIYQSVEITGLTGIWTLSVKNEGGELMFVGYACLTTSGLVAATDSPDECDCAQPVESGTPTPLDSLIATAEANIDYDLVGSTSKAIAFITALRSIIIRRPQSVSVGGNPVAFETLKQMLERAESWYRANQVTSGSTVASGGSASHYYDLSNIRR